MDDSHMHDLGGMHPNKKMMIHMTFYWGKDGEVLFSGWPGTRSGMYALALILVFVMGLIVEWLSHSRLIKPGAGNVAGGIIQTVMHAIRVGLAYLVMLALMSFNVGVFLAAVAGQALGFLLFGSRVFEKTEFPPYEKTSDLPPTSC